MRATVNTRLTLAGAAIAAAAALVSCGNTTGGNAVCPGCGTVAEPSFPTPRPVGLDVPTPSPGTPAPGPTATAAPGTRRNPAQQ